MSYTHRTDGECSRSDRRREYTITRKDFEDVFHRLRQSPSTALRQSFALRPNDGLLSALRDSTRDSEGHDSNKGPLSNGVGSIQIVRPSREAVIEPSNVADASLHDDGLSAARGIAVSVAFGIGFWSLIGGLIRFFIF